MTAGESSLVTIVHVFFAIILLGIISYYKQLSTAARTLSSGEQYQSIERYCTTYLHPKNLINPLVACQVRISWLESAQWVPICNTLTTHKTYPRRWYKISGECNLKIFEDTKSILKYRYIFKL
jgi:hypothetical protein